MANPSLLDILAAVANARGLVDALFARLQAISPDSVKGDELALKAALDAALDGLDPLDVQSSVAAALKALKDGRSIAGGGADASLA
jgi:hypothetical protein